MAYLPDADTVDGYNASDLLKQVVQNTAPAGDVNTRWINSDTGVEYRWNTGTSAWVVIGSAASSHAALTGLAGDDHTQYAPVQVINAGDTPSATYRRAGSIVVRRNAAAGTALGYVSKQGDSMTGPLSLASDPSSALHAATKQYADQGGFQSWPRIPATGDGWYRIAVNGPMVSGGATGDRAAAVFRLYAQDSGKHDYTEFSVSTAYGAYPTLCVRDMTRYSTVVLSQVRIITGAVYDGCAVEVYLTNLTANTVVWAEMQETNFSAGFTPVNFTAGSIPAGMSVTATDILVPMNCWITAAYLNSWTTYSGAPWNASPLRFRKNTGGLVVMHGFIQRATNPAANSTVANLPVGYRPLVSVHKQVISGGTTPDVPLGLTLNIMTFADGNRVPGDLSLQMSGATKNQWSWVSFDGVSFQAGN